MARVTNLLLILYLRMITSEFVLDLMGKWNVFRHPIFHSKRGISGQVPGSMYTALLDANLITDPLFRDNDVQLAWVGHQNWTYSRFFQVTASFAKSQSVLLVFEGVDTVADVFVNGHLVGRTDNMFIKYSFNIKPLIQMGNNSIAVSFQSAVGYALKAEENYPYNVPPVCPDPVQNGQCHVNFIRKEQCSFSWDWGPSFPSQGIWKPVYLRGFNSAVIYMASIEVIADGSTWQLRLHTFFNVSNEGTVTGQLHIKLQGTSVSMTRSVSLASRFGWDRVSLNVTLPQSVNIKRWWPNGYGEQTLYTLIIIFDADGGETSSITKNVGFRTIDLVQDPVSHNASQGLTFYFRVNGVPIFFKGSNWIPADSFQERITKDKLRLLLQSAADVHMNSLRVWGGGVYESEDFYDLCDELGILVWQDLMFSVAMYPTDPHFLTIAAQEVRYQVRRLMHRPSILLWAGNNENEKALRDNWFGTSTNYSQYYKDYVQLYVGTIMPVVQQENPDRVYLTSSPSDGKHSSKQGYVAQDPGSQLYGDIHFYDYSIDQWVANQFEVPRFASEYGIQAWCNYETLKTALNISDMGYNSTQAQHRQHHANGGQEMQEQIERHLEMPPTTIPEPLRFQYAIYLTQINQAMSIKSQTEHYRRHQSALLSDGRGLTMGALYWQLNDIWQAPTWASIDYSGRWKMLQYYTQHFFKPLLVSPYLDGNTMRVYVVVDELAVTEVRDADTGALHFEPAPSSKAGETSLQEGVRGVLTLHMYHWTSFLPLRTWTLHYQLNTTADLVAAMDVQSMMSQAGCASSKDCFIYMYVNDANNANWLYLHELKDSHLPTGAVQIGSVTRVSSRQFSIVVTASSIAPFVWLDAGSVLGRFSDNGFLQHQPSATVQFTAWQDVDVQTLHTQLSVMCLLDVYRQ